MKLYELLKIRPGVTAVIGSGGKTGLLYQLAEELHAERHGVLLATTTHIKKPDHLPFVTEREQVCAAAAQGEIICVGTEADGKVTEPSFEGWQTMAEYVLVEADGSRMMPVKAHASHEPVIPTEANQTICVVGASGFGKTVQEAVHRPDLFCTLVGITARDIVRPIDVARVLTQENLCDRVYLNQVDLLAQSDWVAMAKAFAAEVTVPVIAGSLVTKEWRMIQ